MRAFAVLMRATFGAAFMLPACAAPVALAQSSASGSGQPIAAQQPTASAANDPIEQQARLDAVAFPLLRAAASLCTGAAAPRAGMRLANIRSFRPDLLGASTRHFTDTLEVLDVAPGSGADRAGLQKADRILRIGSEPVPIGAGALAGAQTLLERPLFSVPAYVSITYRRDATPVTAEVRLDPACKYSIVAQPSETVNAFVAGNAVVVTTGMLRFADDDELAVALSHQIAHNTMRHPGGVSFAAIANPGPVADIAFAESATAQTSPNAAPFGQELEREADYVGQYVLALGGRPFGSAGSFWRHITEDNAKTATYAAVHPTVPERFVGLDRSTAEIESKVAQGAIVHPDIGPAVDVATTPTSRKANQRSNAGDVASATEGSTVAVTRAAGSSGAPPRGSVATGSSVEWTFGPPVPGKGVSMAEMRRRARLAYEDGLAAKDVHLWDRAEQKFREATQLDGSVAAYHGALGAMLLKLGHPHEAEAVLSAAVLLDVENAEYHRLLLEARARP
jgi:hypothetical protein